MSEKSFPQSANISMYCDAKEIRFRNREELTLKSKAKTFLIDILLDIVGGCFIAIGVYNFAVASGFTVAGISGYPRVNSYTRNSSVELKIVYPGNAGMEFPLRYVVSLIGILDRKSVV